MKLSEKIKEYRKIFSLSQEQLAKKLNYLGKLLRSGRMMMDYLI